METVAFVLLVVSTTAAVISAVCDLRRNTRDKDDGD
jgi:hypothetical protein